MRNDDFAHEILFTPEGDSVNTPHSIRRSLKKFAITFGIAALIALPWYLYENFLREVPLRISRETTFFTPPVLDSAETSSFAALSAHFPRDIPPEENLLPLFWELVGCQQEVRDEAALSGELQQVVDFSRVPTPRRWDPLDEAIHAEMDQQVAATGESIPWDSVTWTRLFQEMEAAGLQPFTAETFPWIAKHFESQKEFWQDVPRFLEREHCVTPVCSPRDYIFKPTAGVEIPLAYGGQLITDLTVYSMYCFGQGETDRGVQMLQIALHLSRALLQVPEYDIRSSVVWRLQAHVYPAVATALSLQEVSQPHREQLQLALELSDYYSPQESQLIERIGVINGYRDYIGFYGESLWEDVERPFDALQFMPHDENAAREVINAFYDDVDQILTLPTVAERRAALQKLHTKYGVAEPEDVAQQTIVRLMLTGQQARGRFLGLSTLQTFYYDDIYEIDVDHQEAYQARHRLLQLWIALTDYRRQHGSYPQELKQLVPDFLAQLPTDPYTAENFHYRTAEDKAEVFTLGANQIDDAAGNDFYNQYGDDQRLGNWNRQPVQQEPQPE